MGLFSRRDSTRRSATPARTPGENVVMSALANLSRRNNGGYVTPLDIRRYLGDARLNESYMQPGISNILQSLEDKGFIEHTRFEDGTGGDRPSPAGLAHFDL